MTKDFVDKDLDKIADESTGYYYEIKKTLLQSKRTDPFESSIFGWKNGAPNPKPPSGGIELVLPNPADEEEVKQRLSPLDDEWLPISQEYKDYYSKNIHFTKTVLLEAVVVALIFGLNDEED
ncbi:hypothetical protein F5ESL0263_03615 [Lactobacillus sp. ESL0263]|uniref:hypothetical protein n=1 Tax=Lactobacillus sp. ESL0263 TaxID=2069350 RepID=UPI000EFD7745|nr:hypothetical protein [Lactobacillus sp. ESL0263]RMC50115.1 hypothetical protein F5ESL0263_03615 [Lactobacillus sp. ESL0263]